MSKQHSKIFETSTSTPKNCKSKIFPQNSIDTFLANEMQLDLLRLITCGSVDDGKSTLIGRLLWDCQTLLDDQVQSLLADSKKFGTQGNSIDFALLVDGLSAEREQGITIDVAYLFFFHQKKKVYYC